MAIQLAFSERRQLRLSSKQGYQRAVALGVSGAIVSVVLSGCRCERDLAPAVREAKSTAVTVAVLGEEQITFWKGTSEASQVTPIQGGMERMVCGRGQVVVASGKRVGIVDVAGLGVRWTEVPGGGQHCESSTREVIRLEEDEGGKSICLELVDGPPSTASCNYFQQYFIDSDRWRAVDVCQGHVSKSEGGEQLVGPKGNFRIERGQEVDGDYSYLKSVTLIDSKSDRKLEVLSEPRRVSQVDLQWGPDEQIVVVAGKVISLPDMEVQVTGRSACILP